MSLLNTYVGYNLSPKLEQVLPSFNSTDLDFLNKKIYSYPSEDDLSGVSASDRALLLNYYKFLNETYFNGGSSINVSENVNTILFSHEHYAKISLKIVEMQTYLLRTLTSDYNSFKNYPNLSFSSTQSLYNALLLKNKNHYINNTNAANKQAFELITRKELVPSIVSSLKRFEDDEKNGVNQIQIVNAIPTKIKNHAIVLV